MLRKCEGVFSSERGPDFICLEGPHLVVVCVCLKDTQKEAEGFCIDLSDKNEEEFASGEHPSSSLPHSLYLSSSIKKISILDSRGFFH